MSNAGEDCHALARLLMVEDIREMVCAVRQTGRDYGISERVLSVMAKVPRHRFVPSDEVASAYYNQPLSIGHGQTISQPYIVALMTELLALDKRDRVLEVGTGSGYQTAVLAELAGRVYSMEIVESLAVRAKDLLSELGYANVEVQLGDGHEGWIGHAPFDAIIVTAATRAVPQSLLWQLKAGGRMLIPVGERLHDQELILIAKHQDGRIHQEVILPVSFVPLTGKI